MLRTIHLHGELGEKYGRAFRLDVESPAEAVRALSAHFPKFRNEFAQEEWIVFRQTGERRLPISESEIVFAAGHADIHFMPAAIGAGGSTFKIILGATIVAAAFLLAGPAGLSAQIGTLSFFGSAVTYGNVALFGTALLLSGVGDMLAPKPNLKGNSASDNRESFLFGSLENVIEEGGPVPLIFGRCIVGSVVISAGISTARIQDPTSNPEVLASTWEDTTAIGGGGGKSGAKQQASPYDTPNTLQSSARVNLIDLLGEGPCGGLVDGLKSVILDGTRVQNDDDTFNTNNIIVDQKRGLPNQTPLKGNADVETPFAVNLEVKKSQPVVRTILDLNADSVRVTARFPALFDSDSKDGKTTVEIKIELKPSDGSYQTIFDDIIGPDKTTSPYERDYLVPLTGTGPWDIRLTRVTDDATRDTLQNQTFWSAYTTIVDHKLSYPNSFLIGISGDSEAFGGNVPKRNYEVYGLEIDVPSNLNTDTREYEGIWDGTFKKAVYDSPAWVLYYLATNRIGGLGEFIDTAEVDKWALYAIGQYFDELVPDGFGGMEPRATFNGAITSAEEAWKVLQMVASAMRSLVYWGAGTITFSADMPTEPMPPVNQTNVVNGQFNYTSTSEKSRHSVVHVTWYDQNDLGNTAIEVVEDRNLIERFGRRIVEVVAVGCTSRAQARRVGLWQLDSENVQVETSQWQAGFDQAGYRPGDVIPLHDPAYAGIRHGGRIKDLIMASSDVVGIKIDAPVTLAEDQEYVLTIVLKDGTAVDRTLTNIAGDGIEDLTFDEPLPSEPLIGALWGLTGGGVSPRPFRIMSVAESGKNIFDVAALIHDPTKYDRIDLGLVLNNTSYTAIPTGPLKAPSLITVAERLILAGGTTAAQRVTMSWTPPADARVVRYEAQWKEDGSSFNAAGSTPVTSIDIDNVGTGSFVFRVRSIDSLGRVSVWAVSSPITLEGLLAPPPDVENFRVTVLGDVATLSWDPVDALNLDHYEVRFTPDVSTPQFGASNVLLPQVSGTSAQTPGLSGTYFIKAVTKQGITSVNAAEVISTISSVEAFNAVLVQQEDPDWLGDKVETYIDPDHAIRLDFTDDIGDWPTLEEVTDISFGVGGGVTIGTYRLSAPIDLSEKYTNRVSLFYRVDATNDQDAISNWQHLTDIAAMSDIAPSEWSMLVEIRVTDDDPTAIDAEWSDWEEFHVGDYSFRGVDFRVTLQTFRLAVSPRLLNFAVSIDMPDRVEGQDTVTCPIGGMRITYPGARFKSVPGVGINTRDLATGDRYAKSNEDEAGFDIEFFNASGVSISRSFGWVAKGYGRVTV